MTVDFSYSQTIDADDPVGVVRLLIGDRDVTDPIFTNGEIRGVLILQPVVALAAAALADAAAAHFSREVNVTSGQTKVEAAQKAKAYRELAKTLRENPNDLTGSTGTATAVTATMFVGGISYAGAVDLVSDSDVIRPSFGVGQDDGTLALSPGFVTRSEVE